MIRESSPRSLPERSWGNITCFIKVCFVELRMWKRLDFNGNNIVSLAEAMAFSSGAVLKAIADDWLGLYP